MFRFRKKKDEDLDMLDIREKVLGPREETRNPPGLAPIGGNVNNEMRNEIEPLGFRRERFMGTPEPLVSRDKDIKEIIERLAFIENQLIAIRSQTETINERLKNIQNELMRRY